MWLRPRKPGCSRCRILQRLWRAGLTEKDIAVEVDGNTVRITADTSSDRAVDQTNPDGTVFHFVERAASFAARSVRLPGASSFEASFKAERPVAMISLRSLTQYRQQQQR